MPKNKLKEGFGFYLLMFFIIIVAFVGVCIVIMLFSPSKNVLGFQYINNNQSIEVKNDTTSNALLNIGSFNYDEIILNTNSANVLLQNSSGTNFDQNAIYLLNHNKGFVMSKDANEFEYSVEIEGAKLIINVVEPNAFLYFSNKTDIIINLAGVDDNAFAGTMLTVNTKSGNVSVGGVKNVGYSKDFKIKTLNVKTTSGSVNVLPHSTGVFNEINIETDKGAINLNNVETIKANDVKLATNKGKIYVNKIDGDLELSSNTSTVRINEVTGNLKADVKGGIIDINTVGEDVNFLNSSEVMKNSKIYIDSVGGDFAMPQARDAKIELKKVVGDLFIESTSGSIQVGDKNNLFNGKAVIKTTTGKISLHTGKVVKYVSLTSYKGEINTYVHENIVTAMEFDITSNSGKINLNVELNNKVAVNLCNERNMETPAFDMDRFSFKLVQDHSTLTNPFLYNCELGQEKLNLNVITRGQVTFNTI